MTMDLQDVLVLLDDLAKYMDNREDVVDGPYGEPLPNTEMTLKHRIAGAIELIEEMTLND